MENKTEATEKSKRKTGRTILINSDYSDEVQYEGLKDVHTTQSGSRFLVFDTKENSSKAFDDLQSKNVRVKYPCHQCLYQATTKKYLDRHIKSIHEGIKYPCGQCEYQATQKGDLDRHRRSVHEGMKYPCG